MINPEKYAYSPIYDVYVSRETMGLLKRKSRKRKGEIDESELVPVKLYTTFNGYIKFHHRGRLVGIQYIYADAFPEQVGRYQDHLDDFVSFCELDHINGHTTIESNFPSNLEWSTPRLNRARTSRRVDRSQVSDAQRKRLERQREYYLKCREDKEWVAEQRRKDCERKKRYHNENKEQNKLHSAEVNLQMELLCKKSGSATQKT